MNEQGSPQWVADMQRLYEERGQRLDDYRTQIAELESQLAEARKDSARVDWLEQKVRDLDSGYWLALDGDEELRAAIDAAMKEGV